MRMKNRAATARMMMKAAGGIKMLRQPKVVTMTPLTTGASAGPKVIMQLPMER